MKQIPSFLPKDKRIVVVLTEFQNLIMILFFPMLIIMIPLIILQANKFITAQVSTTIWCSLLSLLSLMILNKDMWNGQSIVHRQLGYQVVNSKTEKPASKVKCFLRNLTIVLWPIEILPLLFTPKRRIGDLIAGTKLIKVPKSDPTQILEEIKQTTWTTDLKWTLLLSFIFITLNIIYFIMTGITLK